MLFKKLRNWFEPLAIFAGWRIGLGLLVFWAGIFMPALPRGGTAPYTPQGLGRWLERLLGVWTHWDGEWFLYVAQVGYHKDQDTTPFFPLYPALVRILAIITGGNYPFAGVVTSGIAATVAFILLYELVKLDFGETIATRAVVYLAAFPTSFFLAACYSESLFLALVLGAFIAVRRNANWVLAGGLIGLAALCRNQGILLFVPLGWEWWARTASKFSFSNKDPKIGLTLRNSLAFILTPCLLLGLWLWYNFLVISDPISFITVQAKPMWNRHSALPFQTVGQAIGLFFSNRGPDGFLPSGYREDPNLLDFMFLVVMALLFVIGCGLTWLKRLPFSYTLYFAITLSLPLFSPANKEPLLSFPRFAILMFPGFIVLAIAGNRWKTVHYGYIFCAVLMLGLLTSRFANWYWVA